MRTSVAALLVVALARANLLEDFKKAVGERVKEAAQRGKELVEAGLKDLKEDNAKLQDEVRARIEKVTDRVAQEIASAPDSASQEKERLTKDAAKVADAFLAGSGELEARIGAAVKDARAAVSAAIGAGKELAPKVQAIVTQSAEEAREAAAKASEEARKAVESGAQELDKVKKQLPEQVASVVEGDVRADLEALLQGMADSLSKNVPNYASRVKEAVEAGKGALKEGLAELRKRMGAALSEGSEIASSEADKLLAVAEQEARKVLQTTVSVPALVKAAKEGLQAAKKAAQKAITAVLAGDLKEPLERMRDRISELRDRASAAFKSWAGAADVAEIANRIKQLDGPTGVDVANAVVEKLPDGALAVKIQSALSAAALQADAEFTKKLLDALADGATLEGLAPTEALRAQWVTATARRLGRELGDGEVCAVCGPKDKEVFEADVVAAANSNGDPVVFSQNLVKKLDSSTNSQGALMNSGRSSGSASSAPAVASVIAALVAVLA